MFGMSYGLENVAKDCKDERMTYQVISPDIEIRKTDHEYTIFAKLPGVSKKDLKLSVEDDKLIFEANLADNISKESEVKSESNDQVVYSEFPSVKVYRRILSLDASHFNVDKIKAELKDGLLQLSVPLKEKSKPRAIEVA